MLVPSKKKSKRVRKIPRLVNYEYEVGELEFWLAEKWGLVPEFPKLRFSR